MASSRQIYPLGDRPSHIRSITSTHPNPRHRPDTLHTHTRVERAHVYRIDAYTHTYVLRLQLIPKSFPSIQTLQCAWFTSYYEINYCLFRHIAPRSVKAGSRPCPRSPPVSRPLITPLVLSTSPSGRQTAQRTVCSAPRPADVESFPCRGTGTVGQCSPR